MTRAELDAAFDKLDDETKALLKKIVFSDSPTRAAEVRTIIEVFHHFRMDPL